MKYEEIIQRQEDIAKNLARANVRFNNIKLDVEGLKKDVIKVLSQEQGYQNVKELLK